MDTVKRGLHENNDSEGFPRRPAPESQIQGGADGHIAQGEDYPYDHGIHQKGELERSQNGPSKTSRKSSHDNNECNRGQSAAETETRGAIFAQDTWQKDASGVRRLLHF
jgi:hypothetical protein